MKARMKYREQVYICGNYKEVNIFPVFESRRRCKRGKRFKPASKVQERLNQKNSEKALTRLINANFTNKDYKLELTFADDMLPDSLEGAKREIVNFFRRVKRARAKEGLSELKYVYSTEQGERFGRVHFHVIMTGGLSINRIAEIWGKGYVDKVKPLQFDKTGCAGIAHYFCKQQLKNVSEGGNKSTAKRWVASHNCVKPEPKSNDYRISKRSMNEIVADCEDCAAWERLYPEYKFADCKPYFNDISGLWYVSLMMYRKDYKPDIGAGGRKRNDGQRIFRAGMGDRQADKADP